MIDETKLKALLDSDPPLSGRRPHEPHENEFVYARFQEAGTIMQLHGNIGYVSFINFTTASSEGGSLENYCLLHLLRRFADLFHRECCHNTGGLKSASCD
jgi:hypothetical protein